MYLFFLLCILLHLSPVSLTGRNPSICFYVSDFIILGLILDSSPFFFFFLFLLGLFGYIKIADWAFKHKCNNPV